jgi:nucleoid-associated protein YgaU
MAGIDEGDAGAEARQPETEPATIQADASPTPAPVQPSPTAAVTPVTPTPVPQPTPAVPEDLVLQVTETPALADSRPGSAVTAAGTGNGFDLRKYLLDAGFPELAELPIEARLQDGKLILQGLVFMDVQRRDLLSLLSQTPGIQDVNAVDVLLRPKATYTVQEGDTLWSIVYDIYGDVERLEEFSAANLDVVPQPGLLRVGDVLKVPPVE